MSNNSQAVNQIKIWLFPTLVAILGTIIWQDVKEIKEDVKTLMVQANVDKTRIDNLEKQFDFYRGKSSHASTIAPMSFPGAPLPKPNESFYKNELFIDTRQKKTYAAYYDKRKTGSSL